MIKNRRLCSLLAASAAALGIAAAHPAVARARSVPASAGRTGLGSADSCLSIPGGGGIVQNGCSYGFWYEIPLTVDGSAPDEWYDVWVTAKGLGSGQSVKCGAHGRFYDHNGLPTYTWSNPGERWLDVLGRYWNIFVPVYVPPGGSLVVDCFMEPGSSVMQVEYR